MKFEEILPYLKRGGNAYRVKDFQGPQYLKNYVYLGETDVMRVYDNGTNHSTSYFDFSDIIADDWEIYKEEEVKE